jgi:hypothetical protein
MPEWCHPFVAALLRAGSEPKRSGGEGAGIVPVRHPLGAPRDHGPFPLASLGVRVTPFALLLLSIACSSPEAGRARGSPGADVKNWNQPVELHAGAEPYHDTPCVTERVECNGPPAVFGSTPPPE